MKKLNKIKLGDKITPINSNDVFYGNALVVLAIAPPNLRNDCTIAIHAAHTECDGFVSEYVENEVIKIEEMK